MEWMIPMHYYTYLPHQWDESIAGPDSPDPAL